MKMKKFEVGYIYGEHAQKFEVIKRTAKFLTIVSVQHIGHTNECRFDERRIKIAPWGNEEAIFPHDELVTSTMIYNA
jgi:hypothetical protein